MSDQKQIKVKVKVHPFDKKHKKYARILEEYHGTAHWKVIEAIRIEVFHPNKSLKERQKAYEDYKDVVLKLKPIFKRLIIERNRLAREEGYKNYFEFITKSDGVPKKSLNSFFCQADQIIEEINLKLPQPPKSWDWYWSEFNIPNPISLVSPESYSLPNDIYKIMGKICPELEIFIPKIKITERKGFNPTTRYYKETKTVTIEINFKDNGFLNAYTLVHELGHAFAFLNCIERGIDPSSKTRYWQEKQAYKTVFQFEESALPEKVRNASRGLVLGDFQIAFFEREIYTNPDQDFERAYAEAINRAYPGKATQEKNPFYVLENNLVLRPCSVLTASIAEAELLLEKLAENSVSMYHHGRQKTQSSFSLLKNETKK